MVGFVIILEVDVTRLRVTVIIRQGEWIQAKYHSVPQHSQMIVFPDSLSNL